MKFLNMIHQKYMMLRLEFDKKIVNRGMDALIDPLTENIRPVKIKNIVFLLDNMITHSGGHTSILRMGTEFEKAGEKVVYVLLGGQKDEEVKKIAKGNLADYRGSFSSLENYEQDASDIIIATASNTVFQGVHFLGYKMYFIQDYEPTFFPLGDRYLMARKTYEMGLHMVSLGKWNKDSILKNCRNITKIDAIDFPCEKSEYPMRERAYEGLKTKKKIVIAAYIKTVGRRLPLITQKLLSGVKECFQQDGIEMEILYFGESKTLVCHGGRNLGKLSKEELCSLYYQADFGYVASLSNISLVPYEMLETGLPVIELEDGSFGDFFPEGTAILTSLSCTELYEKLKYYLSHGEKLREMINAARQHMEQKSWTNSAKQFLEIIKTD